MKKYKLLVLFALLSNFIVAQHYIGFKLNFGPSWVQMKPKSGGQSEIVSHENAAAFSGQIGTYYNYKHSSGICFGMEINFVQIEGRGSTRRETVYSNGTPTGYYTLTEYNRHFTYLAVPVYVGYYFNGFQFNAGFQPASKMVVGGKNEIRTYNNGNLQFVDRQWNFGIPLDKYDIGFRLATAYSFSDVFTLELNYYRGLNNLVNETAYLSSDYEEIKIQQLTIGLRWSFFVQE
jgi:hypothetical protein